MSLSQNEADLASVRCLGDQVRDRLYAFVSSRGEPVRRDEAAAAVGIGRALAVYHLDKLVESGLLTASYRRPLGRGGPGAGRPAKVYARSGGEFMVTVPPREYQLAAGLLVQAVAADPSRPGPGRAARRRPPLGASLGERHRADCAEGDGLRSALEGALLQHGFEPWRDDHGTVRMRNCPFRRLAEMQPEVICHMSLALVEGMVAGLGADSLNPVHDPEPGYCCVAIPRPRHDMNGTT